MLAIRALGLWLPPMPVARPLGDVAMPRWYMAADVMVMTRTGLIYGSVLWPWRGAVSAVVVFDFAVSHLLLAGYLLDPSLLN